MNDFDWHTQEHAKLLKRKQRLNRFEQDYGVRLAETLRYHNCIQQLAALLRQGETLRLENKRISLIRYGRVLAMGHEAVTIILTQRKEVSNDT